MDVVVSAKTLETLVSTVGRLAAGDKLSAVDITKAQVAVSDAEARLSDVRIPEGVTPGRSLGIAPAGVEPLYKIDFAAGDWRTGCSDHARAIISKATEHRADIVLGDVEPWQADTYQTKGGYLGRLSVELQHWGFDTLKTQQTWAFYAPGAAGAEPSARKAFANVPN